VIDDPDIEQAVERLERELRELRASLLGVRDDLSAIRALLETLVEETQRASRREG
jgi:multidrug resistance efflux pump